MDRVGLASWWGNGCTKATIHSRPERVNGHIGTETRQTPTGGSSGEYCTMGETLMQRRRVKEEVSRYVNFYQQGRIRTVPVRSPG